MRLLNVGRISPFHNIPTWTNSESANVTSLGVTSLNIGGTFTEDGRDSYAAIYGISHTRRSVGIYCLTGSASDISLALKDGEMTV